MEWLAILGLALWCVHLMTRLEALRRQFTAAALPPPSPDARPCQIAAPAPSAPASLSLPALQARLARHAPLLGAVALLAALLAVLAARAWTGAAPLSASLALAATSSGALFVAAQISARRTIAAQALETAAIATALFGIFLVLHRVALGGQWRIMDAFAEHGVQVFVLCVLGAGLLAANDASTAPIARLRGHVFLAAGLFWALLHHALLLNPWWGLFPAAIEGPLPLDITALGFGAPALAAAAAAARLYRSEEKGPARLYAGTAALFFLLWLIMMIRRAFTGAAMSFAPVSVLEAQTYALGALALAAGALKAAHSISRSGSAFAADAGAAATAAGPAAIGLCALIGHELYHPFWGPTQAFPPSLVEVALSVAALGASALLAAFIAALLPDRGEVMRRLSAGAALAFAVSFGLALNRFLHLGAAMGAPAPMQALEGVGYALWPLGLCVLLGASFKRAAHELFAPVLRIGLWGGAIFAGLMLWLVLPPWWGAAPMVWRDPFAVMLGLGAYVLAAALTLLASQSAVLAHDKAFARAAPYAVGAHAFVFVTLLIHTLFVGQNIETWVHSVAWAVFGAAVFVAARVRLRHAKKL